MRLLFYLVMGPFRRACTMYLAHVCRSTHAMCDVSLSPRIIATSIRSHVSIRNKPALHFGARPAPAPHCPLPARTRILQDQPPPGPPQSAHSSRVSNRDTGSWWRDSRARYLPQYYAFRYTRRKCANLQKNHKFTGLTAES